MKLCTEVYAKDMDILSLIDSNTAMCIDPLYTSSIQMGGALEGGSEARF